MPGRAKELFAEISTNVPHLELFFDVVVIPFGTAAGNKFTDKACHKKLRSQQDCDQCQIEKRLVGNWPEIQSVALLNEFVDDDPQGDYSSCQKHQYTRESEKVHRLFAKPAQEPQ